MASSISTPTSSCFCLSSTSSTTRKQQSVWTISNSAISLTKVSNFKLSNRVLEKGMSRFSQWNGLKALGISNSRIMVKMGRKGKCKGKGVFASLFGVGAPEALVIGVVALLVFGPKGLAEVARNLGKTLRAFQPTIRELQDVSREFKSTLEREIGLDEIQTSNQNAYRPNITKTTSSSPPNSGSEDSQVEIDPSKKDGSPAPNKAYSSEDYLKITEEQLRAAAAAQQNTETASTTAESPPEVKRESQDTPQEAASTMPSPGKTENEK